MRIEDLDTRLKLPLKEVQCKDGIIYEFHKVCMIALDTDGEDITMHAEDYGILVSSSVSVGDARIKFIDEVKEAYDNGRTEGITKRDDS